MKTDYKKELKEFYNPSSKEVSVVEVPAWNFLMIDGKGDPSNSKEFQEAIEALYTLSYSIKFDFKKNKGIDYGVLPLEGLWWADNMDDFKPGEGNRNNWQWILMIMQPEFVTKEIAEKNREEVIKKKNPIALPKVRFEKFAEGKSVQIMHIGPFSTESPNIEKLHNHISSYEGEVTGKHHEIYLSDFRKVSPEKMITILRQPYK